jgi:hypothetical protein
MIICNNCMKEFDGEDSLKLVELNDKEICKGCQNCKTDAYLMDVEDSNLEKR